MDHHRKVLRKNRLTALFYLTAAAGAWVSVYLSYFVFILVPVLYFMPERRLAEPADPVGS